MQTSRRFLLTGSVRKSNRAAISPACLAGSGIHCQSCGDACTAGAIRFAHRLGGPPMPLLLTERCTGCGDCLTVCPAGAISIGHA
jgi:ferredoxin-type protein NapF